MLVCYKHQERAIFVPLFHSKAAVQKKRSNFRHSRAFLFHWESPHYNTYISRGIYSLHLYISTFISSLHHLHWNLRNSRFQHQHSWSPKGFNFGLCALIEDYDYRNFQNPNPQLVDKDTMIFSVLHNRRKLNTTRLYIIFCSRLIVPN